MKSILTFDPRKLKSLIGMDFNDYHSVPLRKWSQRSENTLVYYQICGEPCIHVSGNHPRQNQSEVLAYITVLGDLTIHKILKA